MAERATTCLAAMEGQVWPGKEIIRHYTEPFELYILKIKICKGFRAGKNSSDSDGLVVIISHSLAKSQWTS